MSYIAAGLAFTLALSAGIAAAAPRNHSAQVARGKYLVTLAGCNDCHTPGGLFGKPDTSRVLAGSEVGFEIPDLGVFPGRNLTPDKETGLGNWSTPQIVTALQTGMRPDGRKLAPIMPYEAFASLKKADALAIAAYLKSLPPIANKVPGPFGPNETPTSFVMKIVPPPGAAPPK
jgi:mono/diheme cytochrome c family protein